MRRRDHVERDGSTASGAIDHPRSLVDVVCAQIRIELEPDGARAVRTRRPKPVGHRKSIRTLTNDPVTSSAMLYALLYAIIRRVLRLGISTDVEAEVMLLRHELAVLRRQIKRPKLARRDKLFVSAMGQDAASGAVGGVH